MNKPMIDKLVDRFLAWPLPASVASDPCASMPGRPDRSGTNLLTAAEAKQMLEHVLGDVAALFEAANELHGAIDRQTYDEKKRSFWIIPADYEFSVAITAAQDEALSKAIIGVERMPANVEGKRP